MLACPYFATWFSLYEDRCSHPLVHVRFVLAPQVKDRPSQRAGHRLASARTCVKTPARYRPETRVLLVDPADLCDDRPTHAQPVDRVIDCKRRESGLFSPRP